MRYDNLPFVFLGNSRRCADAKALQVRYLASYTENSESLCFGVRHEILYVKSSDLCPSFRGLKIEVKPTKKNIQQQVFAGGHPPNY